MSGSMDLSFKNEAPLSKRNLFMEFRWIALIALWTLLSGPIFYSPSSKPGQEVGQQSTASGKLPASDASPRK
jgi:hypothetical protein